MLTMGSLEVRSDRVDPLVGSMLGKDYRVIEPIGFGGMAVVYLVEHQTLRKRFAAKVLSVELAANLEARARFNQEAHAASQLDQENIVNISDFGETADHRPFFVMELLRGQTLDQRVTESPMSIEEVVAVAVPVARALAHAHAEGIIHRDVKPENVFLVQRSQGRFGVKVVDFGIAKTPVDTRLTKMGETLGSPMFMSPEACRGEDVDHRADLYSFGVLLYLMLCRRVPFEDENLLRVLQMQVSEPLPPPRAINPEISPELAQVIERALAKDPDDRYISMDALLIDLEAAVPPGSDRLLIETQTGGASSFRIASFTGPSARIDSQQLARLGSQPLPSQCAGPQPAIASSGALSALGRPGRRRLWLAAPVIGVAAIGGWLAMRGGAPAAPMPAQAAARVPGPPIETTRAEHRAPEPAVAAASAARVESAPAGTVHLHLTTTPAGAVVQLDGEALGATPLDVDLARLDGEAQLVVSHDGFTEVRRRLDLRADLSLSLALSPIARVPKIIRRPAPPVPVRREPAHTEPPAHAAGSAAKGDPNLDIRLSR
ncbi:MAG: PEGA domain-containing protein [Deltaproteobacteria bacterium]|nr:MAG: PEGA domain-containing protein [Deltaproteobacteria bacterium]